MNKYIKGTESELEDQLQAFAAKAIELIENYRTDKEILQDEEENKYAFKSKGSNSKGTLFLDKIYTDSVEGTYIHHPDNFITWEDMYRQAMISVINPDLEIKEFELTPRRLVDGHRF